jgi:hypothetical protein
MPSGDEKDLVLGYVTEAQGDFKGAGEYFSRVHGPASGQAHYELGRLSALRTQGMN